jgi:hypothetical protein
MEPAVRVELTTNGLQILMRTHYLLCINVFYVQRTHLFCNCFVFSSFLPPDSINNAP